MSNMSKGSGFFYTTKQGEIKGRYYLRLSQEQVMKKLESDNDDNASAKLEDILYSKHNIPTIVNLRDQFFTEYNSNNYVSGVFEYDDNQELSFSHTRGK